MASLCPLCLCVEAFALAFAIDLVLRCESPQCAVFRLASLSQVSERHTEVDR